MENPQNQGYLPPSPKNRWLIFVAFFLIILGQILLYATPINDEVVIPSAMTITIVGAVLLLVGVAFPGLARKRLIPSFLRLNRTAAWIVAGIAFSILATIMSIYSEKVSLTNYIPAVTLWLFSGLALIAGFFNENWGTSQISTWAQKHKSELIAICLIVALGAVLRFYQLGDVPQVINGDEARIGMIALNTYSIDDANPFQLWENIGKLYLHAINFGLEIFGVNPLGLRLMPAIGGVLAIACLYLFARQLAGARIALIASLLMAFTHTHLHFSRTVAVSYIQGTWLIPLALYFLISGLQRKSNWRVAAAAFVIAIHNAVYLDAQIIIGILVIFTLISALFLRQWFKAAMRQFGVFWTSLLITLVPIITYFFNHQDEFLNRLNDGGTFQSGWLAQEVIITGKASWQILIERVIHAFLSVIYYPALDFYGSPAPILSLISSSLFLAGLAIVLWKTKQPNFLLLNGYFWGATVSIGLFSIPPSADSYRMLIALPPALIMLAIGLDYLLHIFGIGIHTSKKTYVATTLVVITSLFIFNVWTYFFEFAGRCRYGGDTGTRFASYLGNYARTVEYESDIYLLADEYFFYGSHESVDFLSNRRRIINFYEPAQSLQVISGETIIANPSRVTELEAWMRTQPGGEIHYIYDCQNLILLAYRLP